MELQSAEAASGEDTERGGMRESAAGRTSDTVSNW